MLTCRRKAVASRQHLGHLTHSSRRNSRGLTRLEPARYDDNGRVSGRYFGKADAGIAPCPLNLTCCPAAGKGAGFVVGLEVGWAWG